MGNYISVYPDPIVWSGFGLQQLTRYAGTLLTFTASASPVLIYVQAKDTEKLGNL